MKPTKFKNINIMKKVLFTVAGIAMTGLVFGQQNVNENNGSKQAQNEQRWRTNGNQAGENDFIGTKNEAPLRFNTNGNERLRITPEGNLGVGVSSPKTRLEVGGTITAQGLSLPYIVDDIGLDDLHDTITTPPWGDIEARNRYILVADDKGGVGGCKIS